MRVVVTGDRYWSGAWGQYRAIRLALMKLPLPWREQVIVHGDCRGVDRMAGEVAQGFVMNVEPIPAHFHHLPECSPDCLLKTGSRAGPIRNRWMLDTKPDLVIAFHDSYEKSSGTKDCGEEARKRNIALVRCGSTHPWSPLNVLEVDYHPAPSYVSRGDGMTRTAVDQAINTVQLEAVIDLFSERLVR